MAKKPSKKVKKSISPHKSFRRTYREDYQRDLKAPGVAEHIARSFEILFKNWKLFLPLLIIGALIYIIAVGVTGFFSETGGVFAVIVFLFLWLTTIFFARQILAKHKVTFRDGVYNSMAPMTSTFVISFIVVIQCLPIILLVIAYASAVQTDFLSTPFYALLFLGFAIVMITISGYLLSSSLIALVAVTAPGIYPFNALKNASVLMMGRRIRFLLRVVALLFVLAVIWAIIMLPLAALKPSTEVLNVIITILACFSAMYISVYLYLYYRWLLKN